MHIIISRMKRLLLLFLLAYTTAVAQRNFTIEETVFGPRKFAPKNIVGSVWKPTTDTFTHLDSSFQILLARSESESWIAKPLVTTKELQVAVDNILPTSNITIRSFPSNYQWLDNNTFSFSTDNDKVLFNISYNTKTKSATLVSKAPFQYSQHQYSNDKRYVSYLIENNIEILAADGRKINVTQDTIDGIVNGSENTHRQEFGINKGMWWSPDNNKLLYYRKDETMVSKYPLPQWDTRISSIKDIRYPMAGMKSEEVKLIIYNPSLDKYTTLQTSDDQEHYLTIVSWDPSSKYVYVGILNRGQDHLKVNQYDANDGSFIKTLFEEKSSSWVEPQHSLIFLPSHTKQFLYQTDKDGYNQLYHYDTDGKLIKHLGYKDVIVISFKGFDSKGNKAYYIGAHNNGLERHLYEVDIRTGKTIQLTQENGVHNASISPSGKYILDQYSNLHTPNKVQLINRKTNKLLTILNAENPLAGTILQPKVEFKTLVSPDGNTPLNARITYPTNFDAKSKYPVMVYLYGGSHAQMITDRWLGGVGYFDLYMAQKGYIVFTLDNRGSDARGRDFTRVTHRNLGEVEMDDQLAGINYLTSLPYVDQSNMGIFGWSYGGYMTTSLMTKHNQTFKAGVAGGPVIDWKYYEVMYGERYMDTPQDNVEGYAKTSLLNKADSLKGSLLIIHGAQDPVVLQQHSMDFLEQCIKAGKQVDYFLYPNHEHNVIGKDRVHMYEKIARYFDMHLKK